MRILYNAKSQVIDIDQRRDVMALISDVVGWIDKATLERCLLARIDLPRDWRALFSGRTKH